MNTTEPVLTNSSQLTVDPTTWRGKALIPVLIYIGLLVAIVSSLGSPLIPTVATRYHVSLIDAQWSLTLTLLVGAVAAPIAGRLGDGPLRRRVLLTALGMLVAGSVLAALPSTVFALLLIGRGMQGVGLALLPLVMSVARDHLEPARSKSTLATLSVTAVVGVGLGYPLTALIAEHINFRAGFWLAAGLGLIAMALVAAVVPGSGHLSRQHFDLPGSVLLGLGLAGLLVGLSEGDDWGWASVALIGTALASVAVLAVWVWHELRSTMALVDLRLMRHRTVLTANVTGILAGVGMYMLLSMIIRYVQTPASTGYGLGGSVVMAGLVLLPFSAASFLSSKFVTYLSRWIAADRVLPVGALAFVLALVLFATNRDQLWEIFLEMGVAGIGIGCSFAVMPRMIVGAIPGSQTASALALNQVLRTVGYSIGSALAATVLASHTAAGVEFPTNGGYTVGAIVAIGLCLVTALLSWALPARKLAHPVDADSALLIEENVDAALSGGLTLENNTLVDADSEPVRF